MTLFSTGILHGKTIKDKVVGRGSVYEESAFVGKIHLYCYVEQIMTPTFGDPIQIDRYKLHRFITETEAYIWKIPGNHEIETGQGFSINPNVKGNPFPKIGWTKTVMLILLTMKGSFYFKRYNGLHWMVHLLSHKYSTSIERGEKNYCKHENIH